MKISQENQRIRPSRTLSRLCLVANVLTLTFLPFTWGFLARQNRFIPTASPQIQRHSRFFGSTHMSESPSLVQETSDDDVRTEKLWSYVYSLQRARKTQDVQPAKSMIGYLRNNPLESLSGGEAHQQACERAVIQALRSAGDLGDYKLVLSLLEASISYANNHPILTPRIFGEALGALSQTKSNASKLKQVWNMVATGDAPQFLQSPLTAFELTVMLKSLASRGKTRACIDLYRQHTVDAANMAMVPIQPDVYTASTLFTILSDSITVNQQASLPARILPPRDAPALQKSLVKLSFSPCWQWNAAVELLGTLNESEWNNHVVSCLLKLQDRAQEVFEGHKNGPQIALSILDSMMQKRIVPDVVTCTYSIKAMGDPRSGDSWKVATKLLNQMKTKEDLPNPNVYSYSAAIVACARCHKYTVALELLEEMRNGSDQSAFVPPPPNTWVYNAALLAIANPQDPSTRHVYSKRQKQATESPTLEPTKLALSLLKQMDQDHKERQLDSAPDTVTYNTVLAIIGSNPVKNENGTDEGISEDSARGLLDEMRGKNILRDAITYRYAIVAAKDGNGVVRMLDAALADADSIDASLRSTYSSNSSKLLDGKASNGLTFVFNSALSELASKGDLKNFLASFSTMQKSEVRANRETTTHLINVLGRGDRLPAVTLLLIALADRGTSVFARQQLFDTMNLSTTALTPLEASHYAAAIGICLEENNIEQAHQILSMMQENGLTPTPECLQKFALAYARAAVTCARKEAKSKRGNGSVVVEKSVSKARAKNAYSITMALTDAPPNVLCAVAKACALTEMWAEAHSILKTMHHSVLGAQNNVASASQGGIELIPGLHRSLLRECANKGNVTAALWFVDDIQRLSTKLWTLHNATDSKTMANDFKQKENLDFVSSLREVPSASGARVIVGMKAEDWTFLLKAASKSGHWRVCISTLQFLRPFLEKYHPYKMSKDEEELSQSRYDQVAPGLTAVTHCLEQASQYGWAVRVIEDWMEWSGRRPRPEAILAAIRALSARNRGQEVTRLLARCLAQGPETSEKRKGLTYEEMLYIGTITALHKDGLYDDADDAFIAAISDRHLTFALVQQDDQTILDLHGLNVALAHSAVRVALRQQDGKNELDLTIVTGRGRNSALRMRPVLRPEVQRMLSEEFYPPLNTVSVPGNLGAIRVSSYDISAWQEHQQEQKGAQMLALAAALKNVSSVSRLRKSIATSLSVGKKAPPEDDSKQLE